MSTQEGKRKVQLALVYGNLPTVEEIDQFKILSQDYDVTVVTSESICGYLTQTSHFKDLRCIALPDYDDNPTYLPGLENVLCDFDVVCVKERLGLYAYQAVKAKWRKRFRLGVLVDNLTPFPGEDVTQMRTIRQEVTNAADMLLVSSEAARDALRLEGVEEARIVRFVPYVEALVKRTPKSRAEALARLGLGEGDFVVAHLGQIEWEEGLLDLLHGAKLAIAQDKSLERRLKIVFCGIGMFAPQVRDRALRLGLDNRSLYLTPNRDALATLLQGCDALYLAPTAGRDRLEGDPYRFALAMANQIPVITSRSALVEEYLGKHRIDFCPQAVASLAEALVKCANERTLVQDIAKKNLKKFESELSLERATAAMKDTFRQLERSVPKVDASTLDAQVLEVESRVQNKQYLAAIDLVESLFKLPDLADHHRANLFRLVGDSFTKLGDSDQGQKAYIEAIEIDPFSAKAYIGLGTVALTKNSYDIAVLHFQKAVSLAPRDEMANLGLGLAFQGLDENDEANKWVVKALSINPENSAAMFTIVKLAYDRQQFGDAVHALERHIQLHPHDHNMIYTLAGIQYKLEAFDEVLHLTQRILEIDPVDARAHSLAKQARRAKEGAKVAAGGTGER